MSEHENVKTPEAIQAFNESVNATAARNYDLNVTLINEGVSQTVIALANALSAADVVASISVERDGGLDAVDALLDKLLDDMRKRAHAAFDYYTQQIAAIEAKKEEVQ